MLIGITGQKFHGKDTAALALKNHHGFIHLRFASYFKSFCLDILSKIGYSTEEAYEFIEGSKKEDMIPYLGKTGRQFMQDVGAFGREQNEYLWVDITLGQARDLEPQSVVITDVRHHNEAEAIYTNGGHVIRIFNPRVPENEFSTHESEIHVPHLKTSCPDIINDGTIDSLHYKVLAAVQQLQAKKIYGS